MTIAGLWRYGDWQRGHGLHCSSLSQISHLVSFLSLSFRYMVINTKNVYRFVVVTNVIITSDRLLLAFRVITACDDKYSHWRTYRYYQWCSYYLRELMPPVRIYIASVGWCHWG